MKLVCPSNLCSGCYACVNSCPKNAITIKDNIYSYSSIINENLCIDCNICHKVCQIHSRPELKKPIEWYQGWCKDNTIREKSSSGGFASAIMQSFIENGGYVASCLFYNGEFIFKITDSKSEIEKFSGSKYVKSNPSEIYSEIRELLKSNKKVLFIGLPCQVVGLKKYLANKYEKDLFTIDLICHGTPSVKLLDLFLQQYGVSLRSVSSISFRHENFYSISIDDELIEIPQVCDRYTIAFLQALTYTQNCYHCRYARIERVSDLTLGDSWGSEESSKEIKKGISLVLCQTFKGKFLLNITDLTLKKVDLDRAIANNTQLRKPSAKPVFYSKFMDKIIEGKSFNRLVLLFAPYKSIKQLIKKYLNR